MGLSPDKALGGAVREGQTVAADPTAHKDHRMAQSAPITILVVNEHAEEIKLVMISLRGFFPDCRIDVAYSAEEAGTVTAATTQEWAVILLDDGCLIDAPGPIVSDLKRHSPYATIILQSARPDADAAIKALQSGVDYFLFKQSPAFLTELLFCTKEGLDTADVRRTADRGEIRHRQLIASLSEAYYELDAEGRFASVSPNLSALLGYMPEELLGRSYHAMFAQADQPTVQFRFNERRSGTRAATLVHLVFLGKSKTDGSIIPITAAVTARGLYDSSGRFLGTVGILHHLPDREKEGAEIQELHQKLRRTEELYELAQQITALSRELQLPLSSMLQESQSLFESIRDAQLVNRMGDLTECATAATELGNRLERLLRNASRQIAPNTINHLIEDTLKQLGNEPGQPMPIITEFSPSLPAYQGDPDRTVNFLSRLFTYAQTYLETVGRRHQLAVRTRGIGTSSAEAPTLFPLSPVGGITIDVSELDRDRPTESVIRPMPEPIDLLSLYQLANELRATLDVSAPAAGPLHLTICFPAPESQSIQRPPAPVAEPALSQPMEESRRTATAHAAATPSLETVPADRRNAPRISTTLPALVTIGSSTWEGTVSNLSLGGADITLPHDTPPIAPQEAYIVVRTAVGMLELPGLAYTRTPSTLSRPAEVPHTHVIIVFHDLDQTKRAVFSSLIDAAGEQSLSFSLELLLVSGPPEQQTSDSSASYGDHAVQDRRETLRVSLDIPIRLETTRYREPARRLTAHMINLSRHGACLLVKEHAEQLEGTVVLHFSPDSRRNQPGAHEPGAPDAALSADVLRAVADQTAERTFDPTGFSRGSRIAVRFRDLTPYAEREINRVIKQYIVAGQTTEAHSQSGAIVSVPRECRNARGQAIAIIDDHLRQSVQADSPVVVMAPGFGQTALDYASCSYYLAAHHFRVLRYDHTNHVGISEGELQHATLRSMQQDLVKVLEFVRHTWPHSPLVVISGDLAARAALKVAAQTRPFDLLLLLNPSVDVSSMLLALHGHDLIADYQFGLRRGIANLFGLNVNLDLFVGDLIAGHYTDLNSTLDDLRLNTSPLGIITCPAGESSALPPADLPHAFVTALRQNTRLTNLPSSLIGQAYTDPLAPPAAFTRLLEQIASALSIQIGQPDLKAMALSQQAQEQRIEQEYTTLRHHGSHITREALYAAHVAQLPQLGNLHEYRKLLDDLYALMSPIEPGIAIVDAGVGQSDLTRAALVNHTYRAKQASWTGKPSPIMIGLGWSSESIGQARYAVQTLQKELATGFVGRLAAMPPLTVEWVQADWSTSLPFKSGSVDRLVCNLSIPYVTSPLAALREWHRVLHPEGRLILTTFHPDTDLSILYRQHLRQAQQDEFSTQAQPTLHYFGRLREAIRHRLLHTFDQNTLSSLLRQANMAPPHIHPVFDGQALVAVVGKRISSSPTP